MSSDLRAMYTSDMDLWVIGLKGSGRIIGTEELTDEERAWTQTFNPSVTPRDPVREANALARWKAKQGDQP